MLLNDVAIVAASDRSPKAALREQANTVYRELGEDYLTTGAGAAHHLHDNSKLCWLVLQAEKQVRTSAYIQSFLLTRVVMPLARPPVQYRILNHSITHPQRSLHCNLSPQHSQRSNLGIARRKSGGFKHKVGTRRTILAGYPRKLQRGSAGHGNASYSCAIATPSISTRGLLGFA